MGKTEKGGYREGLGTQYLEANAELRHSGFSRAESAVMPFEKREGMEGKHALETINKVPPGFRGGSRD